MITFAIVSSILLGGLAIELSDVGPRLARRIVRRAARWWSPDPDDAADHAEEWAALVDERPGKLRKLGTASAFFAGAIPRAVTRPVRRVASRRRDRPSGRPATAVDPPRVSSSSRLVRPRDPARREGTP